MKSFGKKVFHNNIVAGWVNAFSLTYLSVREQLSHTWISSHKIVILVSESENMPYLYIVYIFVVYITSVYVCVYFLGTLHSFGTLCLCLPARFHFTQSQLRKGPAKLKLDRFKRLFVCAVLLFLVWYVNKLYRIDMCPL